MKMLIKKKFDTVEYFRAIKQKIAERMENMSLAEQKKFLRRVRDKEISL